MEPDTQDQLGKVGNMGMTNDLDEEGHEATTNSNDTETLLVILKMKVMKMLNPK